ncbi:alpha/beta fold hydrolase [Streptosporangium saharense]|uniref:Pimeloyl-ACP methyl ester carboxylesterase n=1 Tax=Streptosporangium saharense TaxID=1706840 RepID=A0A7W7QJU9_9ACTN|nr:alpha/beta fold hydrolase [Streptosporangium saharense]MBB4914838.1 pimeloyl-ACP methyl ester carboxylesterase [Streptosporangium saharense]
MSTIVLVGGMFLGAWAWERVTPSLTAHGHRVHPLTLTGLGDRAHLGSPATTLTTHARDITAAIEYGGLNEVVLVAHSYAGAPATVAANAIPERIAQVVYVAASLPEPGRSLFDITPAFIVEAIMATVRDGLIPVMSDEIIDANLGEHGLTPEDRAWLRARGVGHPIGTYQDPAPDDLDAVRKLPRTYITCTGDPGDQPDLPGHDMVALDSGHWPMITRPVELARVLDEADRS